LSREERIENNPFPIITVEIVAILNPILHSLIRLQVLKIKDIPFLVQSLWGVARSFMQFSRSLYYSRESVNTYGTLVRLLKDTEG